MARWSMGPPPTKRGIKQVRRLLVTLALAVFLLAVAAGAGATHTMKLTFDPSSPVAAGTVVTVTGEKEDGCPPGPGDCPTGNHLQIHQCVLPNNIPTPFDVCLGEAPDGSWVQLVQVSAATNDSVAYVFDTTGLGGVTAGFKAVWVPEATGDHPNSIAYGNIEITGGNGHPGCKGIENAYDKVTSNNGSTKSNGRGAQALEAVAEKIGCDLPTE